MGGELFTALPITSVALPICLRCGVVPFTAPSPLTCRSRFYLPIRGHGGVCSLTVLFSTFLALSDRYISVKRGTVSLGLTTMKGFERC